MSLGCTVEELLRRISSKELTEWAAFEGVNGPLGGRREDINIARVVHAFASAFRSSKKEPEFSHFIPEWGSQPPGKAR